MVKKPKTLVLLSALFSVMIIGTGAKIYWQHNAVAQPSPPNVKVIAVHARDVPITYEYPGKAESIAEAQVRSQVNGILLKQIYQEGQIVKSGALMFEIDPSPFTVALNKAQAQLESARTNLWNTEQNWKRVAKLYKTKGVSTQERDSALSEYEAAKSAVAQTKADLAAAEINLGYTKITAPIQGLAGQAPYSEGNLIEAGGTILTTITQLNPIYINFAYPDNDWQQIQHLLNHGIISQPEDGILNAEIRKMNEGPIIANGSIDFTDSSIDLNTASIAARANVPNPDSILMPGQFVHVTVQGLSWKNALVVPERSLIQGAKEIVYVVNEQNIVRPQPVTSGPLTQEGQIIVEGLKEGDLVIVEGMITVQPGQSVHIIDTIHTKDD